MDASSPGSDGTYCACGRPSQSGKVAVCGLWGGRTERVWLILNLASNFHDLWDKLEGR